ncbi:MAG: long-chain-fatty-acid--CoA ligase [Gammaproteobacteria bacterium]
MYLTQALARAVQICPEAPATLCAGRVRSWVECQQRVAKLAGALHAMGVKPGDRVAILATNSDRYLEFMFAVVWAGAVFVPVNIRLAPPEVEFWLADSGSEVLFIDEPFLPVMKALEGRLERLREIVYVGDAATPAGMHDYETLLAAAEPAADAERGYEDLAGIYYTGGTTGRSKGVMLSHRNLVSNNTHVIAAMRFDFGMRWLHAAPMFHIADSLATFSVTMVGGSHVFIPGFTPQDTAQAIADHRVTYVLLVPTMVNMLVNHPEVDTYDLSSLRDIVYGASPMPESVIVRAMEVLPGCRFTHAYGQTECAPLVTTTGPEYHVFEGPYAGRYKSAGRAVIGVQVKIADEQGNELPRGTVGEVCSRGPNIMLGYWQRPDLTAEAIRDGWMHSGDAGYMDEDGFIYIVDRMKDMIITGGENVYTTEVEDVLYQHPAVVECAIIGIPDQTWGEAVHAVVRLREGAAATGNELLEHCRQHIAGFKCPRSFGFRDEPMPLSGAGKILKTELREPYWSDRAKQVN